jgi:uncharacterized protein
VVVVMLVFLMTGALSGLLAGLLGIGGGLVIVPALFLMSAWLGYPDDVALKIAVATSLAVIIPTSVSAVMAHTKRQNIDINSIFSLAPGVVLGAILGAQVAGLVSVLVIKIAFSIVVTLVSIRMLFKHSTVAAWMPPLSRKLHLFTGMCIGMISAMVGIGGGTLSVPYLRSKGVEMTKAIGSGSALGFFVAVPGMIGFLYPAAPLEWTQTERWFDQYIVGYVHFPAAILIALSSSFVASFGAHIATQSDKLVLEKVFAIFLMITAIRMLLSL